MLGWKGGEGGNGDVFEQAYLLFVSYLVNGAVKFDIPLRAQSSALINALVWKERDDSESRFPEECVLHHLTSFVITGTGILREEP